MARPKSLRISRICKLIDCDVEFQVTEASDKFFCSRTCARKYNWKKAAIKGGLKSAQVQVSFRRSKNEIAFANLCKQKFYLVLENAPIFNGWDADVIIKDLNVAVLWNGKWHYEKITLKHSVEQVQNRDRIKLKEIEKCGFIPYVVKDLGRFNQDFVLEQFKLFCLQFDINPETSNASLGSNPGPASLFPRMHLME